MAQSKRNAGRDMDEVQAHSGRGEKIRPGDIVDVYAYPEKKYAKMRFFGPIFTYGGHWVTTKKREGGTANFFTPCLAFDPATGRRDPTKKCPWCSHGTEDKKIRFAIDYWSNAIIRALQKNAEESEPTKAELKTGFKDKDSETWTPVRAVRLSGSVFNMVKDLKQLNVHENEEQESVNYAVSHPKFGCDVMIKFNGKDAPPATKYSVQKGDASPLKKAEKAYLPYDLSALQGEEGSLDEAEAEYKSWLERNGGKPKSAADDDDDDEDDLPKKGKKKSVIDDDDDEDDVPPPKKKTSKKPVDEDDDEDDAPPPKKKRPPADEDDEDEDEPPKKSSKKKPVDEDDEDDEDDEPVKAKKKPTPAKKKAPVEDDEDEDEDDEPPAKSKKRKPVDEDDDDEDDAPPPKSKKKAPVEDDDDEDDEPPVRKKPAAKAKKKVVEDDDEDDDDL